MTMKEMEACKGELYSAIITCNLYPEQVKFSTLLDEICKKYGTEVTAICCLEMGLVN